MVRTISSTRPGASRSLSKPLVLHPCGQGLHRSHVLVRTVDASWLQHFSEWLQGESLALSVIQMQAG